MCFKDDAISRQAAIDSFWSLDVELRPSAIDAILKWLNELPSVQPDVIRCKDCKWKNKHNCTRAVEVFITDEKYCAWAERKEGADG